MNEKIIKFSPNKSENILDLSNSSICNICISGIKLGFGQINYKIDLEKDDSYIFSNSIDSGYVLYTLKNKSIEIFGSIMVYIVYN